MDTNKAQQPAQQPAQSNAMHHRNQPVQLSSSMMKVSVSSVAQFQTAHGRCPIARPPPHTHHHHTSLLLQVAIKHGMSKPNAAAAQQATGVVSGGGGSMVNPEPAAHAGDDSQGTASMEDLANQLQVGCSGHILWARFMATTSSMPLISPCDLWYLAFHAGAAAAHGSHDENRGGGSTSSSGSSGGGTYSTLPASAAHRKAPTPAGHRRCKASAVPGGARHDRHAEWQRGQQGGEADREEAAPVMCFLTAD